MISKLLEGLVFETHTGHILRDLSVYQRIGRASTFTVVGIGGYSNIVVNITQV